MFHDDQHCHECGEPSTCYIVNRTTAQVTLCCAKHAPAVIECNEIDRLRAELATAEAQVAALKLTIADQDTTRRELQRERDEAREAAREFFEDTKERYPEDRAKLENQRPWLRETT